jgi:glycosyltransferase involved in cell wall biosynthesis
MNILIVSPFLPHPPDTGGRIRIFHLIKELGTRHKITLLCYLNEAGGERKDALEPYCRVIGIPYNPKQRTAIQHLRRFFSPLPYSLVYVDKEFEDRLSDIARQPFDLVQFEFLALAHYVDRLPGTAKKVLVAHYLAEESRRRALQLMNIGLKKFYYAAENRKIVLYEKSVIEKFDLCLVTSPEHHSILSRWKLNTEVAVNRNGVDIDFFSPAKKSHNAGEVNKNKTLVFMGSFDLDPANIDGLQYLVDHIFPRIRSNLPGTRLEIVGRGVPEGVARRIGRFPDIALHGYLEDVRPLLREAGAFLIPLRGGSGTKIRILTAMAMGLPVVATNLAAAGLAVADGMDILIADSPEAFARKTIAVLTDSEMHHRIAAAARALVEVQYSWKAVAEDLQTQYRTLLGDVAN